MVAQLLAIPAEGPVWDQAVMGWTPPRRRWCARVVAFLTTEQEASVSEASTIGLDLAKRVFQAHGADASGKVVFRKRCGASRCLRFSLVGQRAWWRWKLAAAPTTGRVRSARLAIWSA